MLQLSQESTSPCLEDCLNLLRGERDEQKLAGLLLATKLSKGDDNAAILSIFKAVGTRFMHRLLITGDGSVKGGADKDAYLKLSVTLLAGFCRVPEIASSQEMISEIPVFVEIISNSFLLLVLESARVKVSVVLNELAYLKYESSKNSTSESVLSKQQNLAVLYSLIEKLIKLISSSGEIEGINISEGVVMQMISGLNETVTIALDYLQDAKDHCNWKGDDLLAAVRFVGSYLAEAPFACKEKMRDLMQYILSVEGEDEPSPFYSICFLLPMLCQTTMEIEGCKLLASFGGHKFVVECLVKLVAKNGASVENTSTIYLACDIILNLLLRRKELGSQIDESHFLKLLQEICFWAEKSDDPSVVMMASSICALVFDLTSEKDLLNHSEFSHNTLERLSQLIIRSLRQQRLLKEESNAHLDLHEIVCAGYDRWAHRFPFIQNAVERAMKA